MPAPALAQPADELSGELKPQEQKLRLALTRVSFRDQCEGGRKEQGMGAEGKTGCVFFCSGSDCNKVLVKVHAWRPGAVVEP